MNQKNDGQYMFFPNFENFNDIQKASFRALRKLHEIESSQIVKFGYGLAMKALCPSNLEQQNVKLALQVFDIHIVEGLLILSNSNNIPDHTSTSDYIKINNTWWSIINVKTPCKS